jgi:SPX domain protein involved in polyphosphate accumulation
MEMMAEAYFSICDKFNSVNLIDIKCFSLMSRYERKYLVAETLLPQILEEAVSLGFCILEVNSQRISGYHTLYYDTVRYDMFQAHIKQQAHRYKIRSRQYLSSGDIFTEIKYKSLGGKLDKFRIATSNQNIDDPLSVKLIQEHSPFTTDQLSMVLENDFNRITLVNKELEERITIDFGINFTFGEEKAELKNLVVIEIKYKKGLAYNGFASVVRPLVNKATGFSKYCTGMSLLYSDLRLHKLRYKINLINNIMQTSC